MDDARRIDEQTTEKRARLLGLEYLDTTRIKAKTIYKEVLSVSELYQFKVIPIEATENLLNFGITTTTSQQVMKMLRERFADQKSNFLLISDSGFREYMKLYDPPKQVLYKDISLSDSEGDLVARVSKTLTEVRPDDMLAFLVSQAFKLKASDIHIETSKNNARVRLRVDGVLHPIAELDHDRYRLLMTTLASAANISTANQSAQTGNINKTYKMADGNEVEINLRVETVPTVYAQDAVLRLFNFKPDYLRLDKLGLEPSENAVLQKIISNPQGLLLIVGPTGSGKTTTLYSILNELNNPERKLITLEDPVEYYINGVTQIPVNSSNDEKGFADKLRAVLRLDPDVIMVGEIRDLDTAKTALQASLTGHLVLSTYHASSAAAALTRLLDAIGENPLFINAIKLITAQRLVRRLDDATKQSYEPNDATKAYIAKIIDGLPEGYPKPDLVHLQLFKPGSSPEQPFGFSGQIAIRELMVMTPELQLTLRKPAREISTTEIEKVAVSSGMLTMHQQGILKALRGETTIEEIARVLG